MHEESRKTPRRHLVYYLPVHDVATGAMVGRLADLTDTGVMLMCEEAVAVDTVLDLQIRPETELSAVPAVDVRARCRWCRPASHAGYDAGFEFIDPRLGTARDIGRLINDIGMTDA